MTRREHWETVYGTKGPQDVSWFEAMPATSLDMIEDAGFTPASCVLDVGGGDSLLVDELLRRGGTCVSVLDIAGAALDRARIRVGEAAHRVRWIEADVTAPWKVGSVDIWHDRAVFHFLTADADRRAYVERLRAAVVPGGAVIIATFAPDGPETCSGLRVARYSSEALARELGTGFELRDARLHTHTTPWHRTQAFQYSRFRRTA